MLQLISIGESETLEFKESFDDEAIETIGAFANTHGGIILVGVKDNGHIAGYQIGKKSLEDIANKIQNITDPRLQPSIYLLEYQQKLVIILEISAVMGTLISVRGRYFCRVGKTNQRMSHEELMRRITLSTGRSWDMTIETDATLENLNTERINRFVQSVKKIGRLPIPEQATDLEVLRKIKLIKGSEPTRAALLLFGNDPGYYFPSAFLKVGRFRTPTLIIDDREIYGTLIDQLDGVMGWFRERLQTEFIISGTPQREVHWEYPLSAIREAVINAICHRDYTSHAHCQIRLYDNHLEVWNPGGLPSALTPEALLHDHDSIPRNRKIAEAFFFIGLIERWGSGTLRIVQDLKEANLPPPKFESESGRFRIFFYKQESAPESVKLESFSERQLKAIAYIKEHGSINNSQYQSIAGISKSTATRELNYLKNKGLLEIEGTIGRGIVYRLKEKG